MTSSTRKGRKRTRGHKKNEVHCSSLSCSFRRICGCIDHSSAFNTKSREEQQAIDRNLTIITVLETVLPENQTVGGRPVGPGAQLTFVFTAGPNLCGATLIYYDILLSAAHCKDAFLDGVLMGGVKLDGSDSRYVGAVQELVHPEYNFDKDLNDVMLIQLSQPVRDVPLQPMMRTYLSMVKS